MTLAIDGGKPAVEGVLAKFNTISRSEVEMAICCINGGPLSGYLGGERHGGWHVERLERKWEEIFGVKHAIAVNSGTSGLLVACLSCGISPGDNIITTPWTMSATAAVPAFLGANVHFSDIEDETFCLDISMVAESKAPKAVIVTNLFGHPAELKHLRYMADLGGHYLIEDNAQAIFAKEEGQYTGCIGHIGIFSGNVHKALQCGEGGICVTNDDDLAHNMRLARNHGEMAGGPIGLNLRLTEVSAAIWLTQLSRRESIIEDRVRIAEAVIKSGSGFPGIQPPIIRDGCTHAFYCVPFLIDEKQLGISREQFVLAMNAEGVPLREGYIDPLYRLPAFSKFTHQCHVAEDLHDKQIILYENCWYSPTTKQLEQFADAFERVVGGVSQICAARAK